MIKKCPYCNKMITYKRPREFSSHVGNCKSAPFYDEKRRKISIGLKRTLKVKLYVIKCKKCGKEFQLELTEKAFQRGRHRVYCSRTCANSHVQTSKQNRSRREKRIKVRTCPICGINHKVVEFNRYCSKECLGKWNEIKEIERVRRKTIRKQYKSDYGVYSEETKFNFNLWEYPEEFSVDLIEQFGWYRYDNTEGVSRDHMVSVQFGFENNICPEIIKHPANCRIIKQKENSKKHTKNCITFKKLKERVDEWNNKYRDCASVR